jgi:WS/DGAT/MGAT family acyltransferase
VSNDVLLERASAIDLMQLASDVGPAPFQVGAILMLSPDQPLTRDAVQAAIGTRIASVPRLRQRLVRTPPGCGRPVWVDDPDFTVARHVDEVAVASPGDERAVLAAAASRFTERLAPDRPLWAATLLTGLAGGGQALVVVLHHVVADGVGGLAVLARLVDGDAVASAPGFPRPRPSTRQLLVDALTARAWAMTRIPAATRRLWAGITELRTGTARAPRCSINVPVGARRRLGVARTELDAVRRVAHTRGGTVNDAVLTAVTGALRDVLGRRGEHVDRFVVSVPVSGRAAADPTRLGNQIGVLPVDLPAIGEAGDRLAAIARITGPLKAAAPRAASAPLLAAITRALAWLGLLRWVVERQRLVTTFVTNLRGPDTQLHLLGAPITAIVPLNPIAGNVTVGFGVLSYAGTLAVTVVADDRSWPDVDVLVDALQRQLDVLTVA